MKKSPPEPKIDTHGRIRMPSEITRHLRQIASRIHSAGTAQAKTP